MVSDKPLIKVAFLIAITFFTALTLPTLGLFFFGAAEDSLDKANFYNSFASYSLLALLALAILEEAVKRGALNYKKFGWLNVLIFEPEQSMLKETPLRKYLTFSNVLNAGIIFGLAITLLGVASQTFFVALPSTEFQVTETGQMILATEPAASSETLFMLVICSILLGIVEWYVKTRRYGETTRVILLMFSTLAAMGIWVGIHYFRYGSLQTQFFATLMFGFIGSFTVFLTGSPIIWYFWHFFNNIFLKASELFTSDIVVTIIGFLIFIYLFILILKKLLFSKKSMG